MYRDKDYAGEADYVDGLIQLHAPGAQSILELGCGTGGHAVHLAGKGYTVSGIDRSDMMLQRAADSREAAPEDIAGRLTFLHGDVRDFRAGRSFDAVVSLFHVMTYQTTDADLAAAFATAAAHLQPRGIFIFDCWYGPAVRSDPPVVRVKRMEDEVIKVTRIAEPREVPEENRVEVRYDLYIQDKGSGQLEQVQETHGMHYLFLPEMEALLRDAGLELTHAEEWLSGKKPGNDTWSVCLVGRK